MIPGSAAGGRVIAELVVSVTVVQQHDGSRAHLGAYPPADFLAPGLSESHTPNDHPNTWYPRRRTVDVTKGFAIAVRCAETTRGPPVVSLIRACAVSSSKRIRDGPRRCSLTWVSVWLPTS